MDLEDAEVPSEAGISASKQLQKTSALAHPRIVDQAKSSEALSPVLSFASSKALMVPTSTTDSRQEREGVATHAFEFAEIQRSAESAGVGIGGGRSGGDGAAGGREGEDEGSTAGAPSDLEMDLSKREIASTVDPRAASRAKGS